MEHPIKIETLIETCRNASLRTYIGQEVMVQQTKTNIIKQQNINHSGNEVP